MVFSKDRFENHPTETEITIFNQVKILFDNLSQEQVDIYDSFLRSRNPVEREALAKKIQAIEEAIIHKVAHEHDLSFDVVAKIVFKVDYYLEQPKH